ncbi:MAG TPA: ROK family protein [Candidatus Limnocylindrales bacterium]|jgi:polyphosphate glucokinase
MDERRLAIGVDVGGSGIKTGAVDLDTGQLVSERLRVATPQPATPEAVIASIARLVRRIRQAAALPAETSVPVGVDLPCVVIDGVTRTAANIDPAWIGHPAEASLAKALEQQVIVLNDADAAGLAEVRFGAGKDQAGVVLVLTLGTGVGSGMFLDGKLIPNTELGHMEIRGRDAERRSAAAARLRRGLSWKAWAADVDEHLDAIDKILWPNMIIIGGGVSKNADRFLPLLTVRPPVVAAQLRNNAGIVGAAMAAAERTLAESEAG